MRATARPAFSRALNTTARYSLRSSKVEERYTRSCFIQGVRRQPVPRQYHDLICLSCDFQFDVAGLAREQSNRRERGERRVFLARDYWEGSFHVSDVDFSLLRCRRFTAVVLLR